LLDVPFQARKRKKSHRSNSSRKMELTNTKINHFMVGIVSNNEFLYLSWNLVTLSLFSNKKQTEK
jgi:hypothetical protein